MQLKFKKLHPDAIIPDYKHFGDSGMNMYALEDAVIEQNKVTKIKTGIAAEIPINFEGQLRARSGLALKHGLTMVNNIGTIDAGYRGSIDAIMTKLTEGTYQVRKGDAIAQLVIAPIEIVEPVEIGEEEELNETSRGEGGFGSTDQIKKAIKLMEDMIFTSNDNDKQKVMDTNYWGHNK